MRIFDYPVTGGADIDIRLIFAIWCVTLFCLVENIVLANLLTTPLKWMVFRIGIPLSAVAFSIMCVVFALRIVKRT